jgi:integrase
VLAWLAARDHTPGGMRNRALVLTYLTTGARASEVIGMRWADLRKARQGCWLWAWRGKGGKRANVLIPAVTVEALAIWGAYRAQGTPRCEYVWRPVQEQGMGNLYRSSGGAARHAEHISAANALRILRSALRGAAIEDWRSIRLHDLRHTLAITLYQETHDLAAVCKQLHHENLSTVRIYLEALQGPDDLGAVVASALGIH